MHWRDPLAESSDPHLASKSHPQVTFGWHGTWPEEASSLGLNSMGSIKAAAAPRHQRDAFHSAGLDQDHAYHAAAAAAAGAVHSPLASSPAHSNTAAGSAAAKRHSNSIDGALLNQLLLQTPADSRSNLHSKASAPSQHQQQQQLLQQLRMPHNSNAHMYDSSALTPPAPGDWCLGTDVQCEPAAAPELQELLSQFPASQHKVLLDSLMASTNPQELLLTLQAAATTDALGSPLHNHHQQQHHAFDHGSAHWMQQAMAAAGTSPSQHNGITDLLLHPNTPTAPNSGNHLLQQLQLQASLAAQQAAMSSSVPAAAASSASAAQQQLLLQQLQSVAAAANNPSALAQLLQQQMYGHSNSNSAAANNLWNNLAAASLGTSPGAAAAALAAQQQQSAMSAFMAQAALAQQRQQQHSSMMAAGQYYQQLAAQLMAKQLAAASGPSSYASLAASSFGSLASSSAPSRAGSAGFGSMPGSFQRAASGFSKGRRNSRALSSSGSSRANSAGLSGSVDVFGYLGSSSGGSSRASSYAGSDMETAADSAAAALAAGLTLQDLCPASFQETWGAATAAAATASNSSSGVSSASSDAASSSSWDSSSGAARPASSASSKSDSCSIACPAAATSQQQQSKGAAGNPASPAATNDAVKASSKKDQRAATAAVGDASCKQQRQLAKVGGCPAWFPGAREASGDDSWYLGCPPTCRLFVGNIGSWVDEDALLGYFGKYGNVVDVQVGCYCWYKICYHLHLDMCGSRSVV
jgi:hypothetical protein